jgi:hypothetical protein
MSHDYNPEWDYTLDTKPDVGVAAEVLAAGPALAEAARGLGLAAPTIHFVKGLGGGHLARYISGTGSEPVFVLDAQSLVRGMKRHNLDVETAVGPTLRHELAHAYMESLGLEDMDSEETVERFAEICWRVGDEEGVEWLKAQGEALGVQLG